MFFEVSMPSNLPLPNHDEKYFSDLALSEIKQKINLNFQMAVVVKGGGGAIPGLGGAVNITNSRYPIINKCTAVFMITSIFRVHFDEKCKLGYAF